MSHFKSTLLNLIAFSIKYTLLSLLTFIVSQQILIVYGSSVNGITATATQVMALLFILEGGFSTVAVTELYRPYVEHDYVKYNSIISTASTALIKISWLTLLIGLPVSFLYPIFLRTDLAYIKCVVIFALVCLTTAFNFYFFQARQIMFSVAQKEYIPQTVASICTTIAQLLMLLLIFCKMDILVIRGTIAIMLTISGLIICILAKKYFPFANLRLPCCGRKLHGTNDMIVSNVVSAVYKAAPIFMIATFFGADMASVYSVYYMIFSMINIILFSICLAPKNAFGQLFHTQKTKINSFNILYQVFETGIIALAVAALITCAGMVIPFMRLYTAKLPDTKAYLNPVYVLFFTLLSLTQIIHIPSGLLLQISGSFKIVRNVQVIMLFSMFIISGVGGILFGITGMLFGLVIANCILAIGEIGYAYYSILQEKITLFLRKLLLFIFGGMLLCLEYCLLPFIHNWLSFFCYTAFIALINLFFLICLSFFLFPRKIRTYLCQFIGKYLNVINARG